jgi:hypothetical protein
MARMRLETMYYFRCSSQMLMCSAKSFPIYSSGYRVCDCVILTIVTNYEICAKHVPDFTSFRKKKTAKALQREDRRHEATSGLDAQGQGSYINESQVLPAPQFLADWYPAWI